MSRVWFSGFETGDLSEWPINSGTGSVQTSNVHSGNYSLAAPTGSFYISSVSFSLTTAYGRCYVYFTNLPTGYIPFFQFLDSSFNIIGGVCLNSNGTLGINDGDVARTVLGSGTSVLSLNKWYCVEFKLTGGGAGTGAAEIKIDNIVEKTLTGLSFTNPGNSFWVGPGADNSSGSISGNIYFDDISVDNAAYPGLGKIIARQGTAGTPTYDTWTKSGAATAALCWSDTPYSTATYCDDSTLSDKQTMLVWPFNTVQTGHGSDTVGPVDTINAAKVSTIAKSASAGNMDILFRYGGSDNATTVTLTTSDAYYESSYLTPTVANVNASEIGATNDLTSVLTTVEDCWLQVDYTPFTNYAAIWPYGV